MTYRVLGICAIGATAFLSSNARATLLYSTGFEQPTFTAGNVVGQDGWEASTGNSNILVAPAGAQAHTGTRIAAYQTANATAANAFKTADHPTNLTAANLVPEPIILADAFVNIANSTTSTRTDTAGIGMYNIAGTMIDAIYFNTSGVLTYQTQTTTTTIPAITATQATWNELSIRLNYATHVSTFYYAGNPVAISAFTATNFGSADLLAETDSITGDGHTIGFDDLSVNASAAPEPTTLGLATAAGAGMFARRRRSR